MTQAEAFAQLKILQNAGFFIICWTPEEVEGVSDKDLEDIEARLIEKGNDLIEELAQDDEAPMCSTCNGSGEGMYDGTRCRNCGGKGVEQPQAEAEV